MCIILDNDIRDQVFGNRKTKAGEAVWHWINGRRASGKRLKISIGGRLTRELWESPVVKKWLAASLRRGNSTSYGNVDSKENVVRDWKLKSNDSHIIAPAVVSGARLLYFNDKKFHKDFGNTSFVSGPRGKIFLIRRMIKQKNAYWNSVSAKVSRNNRIG